MYVNYNLLKVNIFSYYEVKLGYNEFALWQKTRRWQLRTKEDEAKVTNPQVIDPLTWRGLVNRLIRSEMTKRGVKYDDLSRRLAELGIHQSADNLRNKINKGILGADLFVQILLVLNVRRLGREDLLDILRDMGYRLDD